MKRAIPDAPDSRSIAAGAVVDWEAVQSRLAPTIGESGFRVLFARSLPRARSQHPCEVRYRAR